MMPRYDNVTPLRGDRTPLSEFAFEAQKALVDHELEQSLLGTILRDNHCYDAVSDFLSYEDFGHPLHGRIYAAIASLIAGNQPATPISLNSYFGDEDLFTAVGGAASYLARLAAGAVTLLNAYWYGKQIHDLAQRRAVVEAANAAIVDAGTPNPDRAVDEVIEQVEQRLYEIAEQGHQHRAPRPVSAVAHEVVAETERAHQAGGAFVVDTGLLDLDQMLRGMSGGDLVILAGRPSMGKSACAGSIAMNVARANKRPMIFTLEMTGPELGRRWIAGRTGIATERLRHGDLDGAEWQKLHEAEAEIAALPITIDDQARMSVAAMRQRARRQKRKGGLDLIVIDHLQLIRQGGRQESRRLEIGEVTSGLKAVAKELGVPVLLLSQLNRKVEDRDDKRPTLADLKESGDIEQDADVVMFLYREHYYLSKSEPRHRGNETNEAFTARQADWHEDLRQCEKVAEIGVAKNRHGRTGIVKVSFDAARQRFENLWDRGVP